MCTTQEAALKLLLDTSSSDRPLKYACKLKTSFVSCASKIPAKCIELWHQLSEGYHLNTCSISWQHLINKTYSPQKQIILCPPHLLGYFWMFGKSWFGAIQFLQPSPVSIWQHSQSSVSWWSGSRLSWCCGSLLGAAEACNKPDKMLVNPLLPPFHPPLQLLLHLRLHLQAAAAS